MKIAEKLKNLKNKMFDAISVYSGIVPSARKQGAFIVVNHKSFLRRIARKITNMRGLK